MERLGSGWRKGGGYFGYQNKTKKGWEDLGLGVGRVLVFRFSVTVGFTGCVHVLLQPFPFPPCFFDVYKSRQ